MNHVKSAVRDKDSTNRIRFTSARKRAKIASADVYRNYKRRELSTATREERVHHLEETTKRARISYQGGDKQAIVRSEIGLNAVGEIDVSSSTFSEELDLALERNGSEIFAKFHRDMWPLVRSLPEVLHHANQIVELLNECMLSWSEEKNTFEVNHATVDILHLYAVLAKDIRHEIHPYLHSKIIPRILNDMLSPPLVSGDKQQMPLDVSFVEAAFRALAYIFRYDYELIVNDAEKVGQDPCLEKMRQYYGVTLGHRREIVRRLAAETFSPLIRKLKSDAARKRHFRRVLRALAASGAASITSTRRMQEDAVDGVSALLFNYAKGVSGKLHSKGQLAINCVIDCVSGKSDVGCSELVKAAASSFFSRLFVHLHKNDASCIVSMIVTSWNDLTKRNMHSNGDHGDVFHRHIIQLLDEAISFRGGLLLNDDNGVMEQLVQVLSNSIALERFQSLSVAEQADLVQLLCTAWKHNPSHPAFAGKLLGSLHQLLQAECDDEYPRSGGPFDLVTQKLLPYLPCDVAMKTIGSSVLSVAVVLSPGIKQLSMAYVHSLASMRFPLSDNDLASTDDSDRVIHIENAIHCSITNNDRASLLSMCMAYSQVADMHGAIAAKAAAFVAATGNHDQRDSTIESFGKLSEWFLKLLYAREVTTSNRVSTAIVLESLSTLSMLILAHENNCHVVVSTLEGCIPVALQLVMRHSSSTWAVKACSSFVRALQKVQLAFGNDVDSVFEALIPNLHSSSHFRRLHTLEILCSYPKKSFVVNHADLDLSEDLDEEQSSIPGRAARNTYSQSGELCSIMETLLEIERTPISLSKERFITGLISRVEVLGRTGNLPVIYAEAAASHMIGLLYVKFSALWPQAVKALVALAKGHEENVFLCVYEKLSMIMQNTPLIQGHPAQEERTSRPSLCDPATYHSLCVSWETSDEKDVRLFSDDVKRSDDLGRVSRHKCTDGEKVLENIWNFLEEAPRLLVNNSRKVVPLVLEFVQYQYFAVRDDPDERELCLGEHLNKVVVSRCDQKWVDRRAVQGRLIAILKAFGAVHGHQQLFKNAVLKSLFLALTSHPDGETSRLSLMCLLQFKPEYLMPFKDIFVKLYEKGMLRDALLEFRTMEEDGKIADDHRSRLFSVLYRVLFNRILSKSQSSKSSKDTPEARRNAILSFLCSICRNESDVYPFVYLMIRPYLTKMIKLKALENQDDMFKRSVITVVHILSSDAFVSLPAQVHQGYLNTLGAIVTQLGHKTKSFVPVFLSITLKLIEVYDIKDRGLLESGEVVPFDEEYQTDGTKELQASSSAIRGLCYQRLSDIFETFSEALDLVTYSRQLWANLKRALLVLPTMAAKAEKAPALLLLLKTMSSKPQLIKILGDSDSALAAVCMCFEPSCRTSVMDACLTIVDNLLTVEGVNEGVGQKLIVQNIGQLLQQFQKRLGGGAAVSTSPTWRRELSLLCRVSDLVGNELNVTSEPLSKHAESLSSILVKFLDISSVYNETDMTNVLGILEVLASKIPLEAGADHFITLSKLLGPLKNTCGIESKSVRLMMARVLHTIAESSLHDATASTKVLLKMCAFNEKKVDEIDFDSVIPTLGDLVVASSASSWTELCRFGSGFDPRLISPLVFSCFHLLFSTDGVVVRSSFRAIKMLVVVASTMASAGPHIQPWIKLLEGTIAPLTRNGLNVKDLSVRRYYILIAREVASANAKSLSPNLHGDLAVLVRDDEPDLDFFSNVTHVQVHRRARALQRLRKVLLDDDFCGSFTSQSLYHILLPIAQHSAYEATAKTEDSLATEGIATTGAIARLLSWSKYNNVLWTHLTQFHRHPDQEHYLVGLLCALIDAFHFDITKAHDEDGEGNLESDPSSAVLRALQKRFIPKIESLLVKHKVDRSGDKIKVLRPSIVLALLKLFKKFPDEVFRAQLPRLITVICDALKSRESDSRDVARETLGKIAIEIDIAYLADIVRELAVTLTQGYQLHVRAATLHTILLKLSGAYHVPSPHEVRTPTPFDCAVPALMDIIQSDLFGMAQERKDVEGSKVRFVKEASGSKSLHAVELIARMILFKPSLATTCSERAVCNSGIHALVTPFLERLRVPGLPPRIIRQVKECLNRIVSGLLNNPSVRNDELLPFVYATIRPFVSEHMVDEVMVEVSDDSDGDEDNETAKPLTISGRQPSQGTMQTEVGAVVEWRPSMLNASKSARDAHQARLRDASKLRQVKDGASAPKLTGSGRNASSIPGSLEVNDPASISAVSFCLQLLGSSFKKVATAPRDPVVLDPFVPLLTACVCRCRDSDVVLLALKSLGSLLRSELPSLSRCARSLASKTLDLLFSSGAATNLNPELLQASFKMLTYLLNYDKKSLLEMNPEDAIVPKKSENALSRGIALPLDAEQMQVLLSFLRASIAESDQHNPAIGLVKAIMSRRYVSAELYDLMETLLELTVRSSKASLREQSASIIVSFLINYPLSTERVENHCQQILRNLRYEHAEGRLSALSLTTKLVERFPIPVVEQYSEMFFIPLAMQLVNDNSSECREAISQCLKRLLTRLSTDSLRRLWDYSGQWLKQDDDCLKQLALQLYGIFLDSCADFMKRGDLIEKLQNSMESLINTPPKNAQSWQVLYFTLLNVERLFEQLGRVVKDWQDRLWQGTIRVMATSNHAWVQLVSSRLVTKYLVSLDPVKLSSDSFLNTCPGALYEIARNFCFQLAADDEEQVDDLVPWIAKGLCWVVVGMQAHPELCFSDKNIPNSDDETDQDEDDEQHPEHQQQGSEESADAVAANTGQRQNRSTQKKVKHPVLWLLTRLSNIAKPAGTKRRQAVYKCFAALATYPTAAAVICQNEKYLELILTPLLRSMKESSSQGKPSLLGSDNGTGEINPEDDLVRSVLTLWEECAPADLYTQAEARVHQAAYARSTQRKAATTKEYVVDPVQAAERRIRKQEREKQRKKRRVEERRRLRGGVAKRRHVEL